MVPSPLVVIELESEALAAEDVDADSQEPDEVGSCGDVHEDRVACKIAMQSKKQRGY